MVLLLVGFYGFFILIVKMVNLVFNDNEEDSENNVKEYIKSEL